MPSQRSRLDEPAITILGADKGGCFARSASHKLLRSRAGEDRIFDLIPPFGESPSSDEPGPLSAELDAFLEHEARAAQAGDEAALRALGYLE